MKIVYFVLFYLILLENVSAQGGNLQFNQVLNIKNGDNYIVPAGKVVKVESIYTDYRSWGVAYNYVGCTYSPTSMFGIRCNYLIANNGLVNHIGIPSAPFTSYKVGEITAKMALNGEDIRFVSDTAFIETSIQICTHCPNRLELSVTPYGGITNNDMPIWLKSGQSISIAALPNTSISSGQKGIGAFITAIEYNVIP